MRTVRAFAVFCIAVLLAGCAGGTPQTVSPPLADGGPAPAAGKGTLTLQISIPKKRGSAKSYVSPATRGMTLVWTGPSNGTQAFKLTHGNPHCTKVMGPLVCTIDLALKSGDYTTGVNLYDLAPVQGQIPLNAHLLSTASGVPFTIKTGQTTSISPKLEGVLASLFAGGFPSTCAAIPPTPFTVTAFDADTYTIFGTYATSITLSDSDTSGATAIATSGKDNPPSDTLLSSSDVATIAWNGNPIPGGAATIGAQAGSVTGSGQFKPATISPGFASFNYTGGSQNFTVPTCATTVYLVAYAASGGELNASNPGGLGGGSGATIPATPGESLAIFVGGTGGIGSLYSAGAGGFNGGGAGPPPMGSDFAGGNGGGGATDVRQGGSALANRVLVAGGGGGSGYSTPFQTAYGGYGGGLAGQSGGDGYCGGSFFKGKGGGGGTQSAGGTGGAGTNGGSLGVGGAGVGYCGSPSGDTRYGSGGGGGGYYGGGGGNAGAGGGGGSAFAEASATNVILNSNVNSGDGFALICWGYSNGKCGSDRLHKKTRGRRTP